MTVMQVNGPGTGSLAPQGARLVAQPKPAVQPEPSKGKDKKSADRSPQGKGAPVSRDDAKGAELRSYNTVRRSALELPSAPQPETTRARRKA
ncbi:MAG: hypothetical protein FJY99_05165 [Candidatus Sericytochromatia bacterium]|nr:hypothetical protein [Candidatus Tanganyikabacteria bacterium]